MKRNPDRLSDVFSDGDASKNLDVLCAEQTLQTAALRGINKC